VPGSLADFRPGLQQGHVTSALPGVP
jgi:hypothetical protein